MYYYSSCGICIGSEIPLPELPAADHRQEPDLKIQKGVVPECLNEPNYSGKYIQISPQEILYRIENVATFHLHKGTTVTIAADPGAELDHIRAFLLGPVLGMALHQRGLLVLHGSAVKYNEQALIFSGISGTGKSTIAAALTRKGFPSLADDLCPITNQSSGPVLLPAIPQLKLLSEALDELGIPFGSVKKISQFIPKFAMSMDDFSPHQAYPVGAVFVLLRQPEENFLIREITGTEKFHALKNNTYRFPLIWHMGMAQAHFEQVTSLARKIRVFQITRSPEIPLKQVADSVTDFILSTFN